MILKFCGIKTKVEALSIRPLNIRWDLYTIPKVNDLDIEQINKLSRLLSR